MKTTCTLLAAIFVSLFAIDAHADWDFEETDNRYILWLNIDQDIDETEVFITLDGSRIRFEIIESVGGSVVERDTFRERFDDDGTDRLEIRGSDSTETIIAEPQTADRVRISAYGYGAADAIFNVTQAFGGDGDDYLYNAINMNGLDGDDEIYAGPLTQSMLGQKGDDRIDATMAERGIMMFGGPDDDLIIGSPYDDTIQGGEGNDYIRAGDGNDEVDGGRKDDTEEDADTIFGEDGDDVIRGGPDRDVIFGGDDNDILDGDEGFDILVGDDGDDIMDAGPDASESDWMFGLSGSDVFVAVGWPDNYLTDYSYAAGDIWFDVRPRRR